MSFIYCDESIHERHDFIVTSMVHFRELPDPLVIGALEQAGLKPGIDEFKSGAYMQNRPHLQSLRDVMLRIMTSSGTVGVIVSPASEREILGRYFMDGIEKLLDKNNMDPKDQSIYVDEGIFNKRTYAAQEDINKYNLFEMSSDSIKVYGLQLADLAAYYCSLLILEELDGPKKYIRIGQEAGFEPFDAELGWVVKTDLRHSFFMEPKEWDEEKGGDDFFGRDLLDWGVFIQGGISEQVKMAAKKCLGFTWLGCIH